LDLASRNSIRVGDWVMGPLESDEGTFVINRLGAARPTMVLRKSGAVFVNKKEVVPAAPLGLFLFPPPTPG
jgi:hypothetical protein